MYDFVVHSCTIEAAIEGAFTSEGCCQCDLSSL